MENKCTELREKLESFYSKETFFEGHLHESCKHAEECWKRLDNKAKKAPWNYFSLPYIGKEYDGKLLCVAANVNKGGGRNLQEMCIRGIKAFDTDKERHENDKYGEKYDPGVIESLEKGYKNINFKNGMKKMGESYGGTPLWHRIAVYSKILLDGYYSNVADDFKELAKIYERIIFMDAIKCSPATIDSSIPGEMEELCPEYIFFKELEIIQPDNILIMYHNGAKLIRGKYNPIEGSKDFPGSNKDIDYCQIKIGEKIVNIYYIVHPTTPRRGNRTGLFKEFADFLIKSKK